MTTAEKVEVAPKPHYEVLCEDTSAITREEWLAIRKQGLGSSDVAPAMDMSPWNSAYALYCDKRNLVPEAEQSERYEWALDLETPILDWVEKKGWAGPFQRHLMVRSLAYPWLLANPDGLASDVVVEAKTANGWDEKRWDSGIPDQYSLQAHALMAVTGCPKCLLPVMFDTNPPREFWVDWDPAVGEPMIERTAAFWKQIQDGVEPEPDGSEATMLALRSRYSEIDVGAIAQLSDDAVDLVRSRDAAAQMVKSSTEVIDGIKATLMSRLGEAEIGMVGDIVICTWNKSEKTGKRTFLFKDSEKGMAA